MAETPDMGMVSAPPAAAAAPAPAAPPPPAENPRARGHSPARDAREANPGSSERTVRIGDRDIAEREIVDLLGEKAERDVFRAGLPQDPAGYEVKLPESFKLPFGLQFEFCETDSHGIKAAQNFAQRHHLPQEAFSEMLAMHASTTLAGQRAMQDFARAEDEKLGSGGPQRLADVHRFVTSMAGEKGGKAIMAGLVTAEQVEAFEAMQRRFSSQGGAAVNGAHREIEVDDPGKIPGYENMSFVQRRVAQTVQANGRKGR